MIRNREAGFATRAIHHGYDPMQNEGALTPPVHMTSTFAFETAGEGGEMFAGERAGHVYSRISNPTVSLLEARMATLEGGEAAVATASGMGAISSVLWTFLAPGDEVLVDQTLYGCTFSFLHHGLAKFGVTVTHVDMRDPANVAAALTPSTRLVYFETPANPNMRLVDIAAVSAVARKAGLRTVVDNTYSTPVLTRPLELGADIVVHSATKYLGGHGDLVAGVAIGSADDMQEVRLFGLKDMTGAVMAPLTAHLVLRGLKTLELRMERHCASARTVAEALEAHPAVARVFYPGLATFAQHDLACRQMRGFGGMIALELKGGFAAGMEFLDGLCLVTRAVSLGDAETLAQHPASMTHSTYTPEERAHHGISDGLVRISVGLESLDDILADLMQALDRVRRVAA
ncbi:methionine gamma-lyase [Stappia sp.]|uniref:methionine gamma-lyase n=1 Tax=Stappia sp. TaxID=1870903 RepID=UPI003A999EE6